MNIEFFATRINMPYELFEEVYFKLAHQYIEFSIPKKNGSKRNLFLPSEALKSIQRKVLLYFLEPLPVSENSFGFRKGFSIVNNAKKHINKECIISLDLEDFFPSISSKDVKKNLIFYGIDREDAIIISELCTYKKMLPQGAPSSPYLSNIVCRKLDEKLSNFAQSINATYSRYADDITFSGSKNIIHSLESIKKIIKSHDFIINDSKTHIRYNNELQIVTGLVVNEKLSIPNNLRKQMRQHIHYCKKFGVKSHIERINFDKSKNFRMHLYGLCSFIYMVDYNLGKEFYGLLNKIDWDS